jgi:hypothetical protein
MCNAWNHSLGCSCGFGGGTITGGITSCDEICLAVFENYVNPFAKCPVCRAPVYFFEDRNGGRVFFDELGPPWQKHPCMDCSKSEPRIDLNLTPPTPSWIKEGWLPFVLDEATVRRSTHVYSIRGLIINGSVNHPCLIDSYKEYFNTVNQWVGSWQVTNPTFVRRNVDEFEVSSMNPWIPGTQEYYFRAWGW